MASMVKIALEFDRVGHFLSDAAVHALDTADVFPRLYLKNYGN
jgi:hypothetical protein